jgi:hypothetical protein
MERELIREHALANPPADAEERNVGGQGQQGERAFREAQPGLSFARPGLISV